MQVIRIPAIIVLKDTIDRMAPIYAQFTAQLVNTFERELIFDNATCAIHLALLVRILPQFALPVSSLPMTNTFTTINVSVCVLMAMNRTTTPLSVMLVRLKHSATSKSVSPNVLNTIQKVKNLKHVFY